jgi:hypothetical protein
MKARIIWQLTAAALCLTASGCGSSALFSATGKLTYHGRPVPSTYVIFQPEEKGQRASRGLTDDHGRFTVTYSRTEKGILPGRHKVFLKYFVSAEEEMHQVPPKASKELRAVINKYGDPETSTLSYEIKKNGQFIEIDLQ